jgi:hypothetical protein
MSIFDKNFAIKCDFFGLHNVRQYESVTVLCIHLTKRLEQFYSNIKNMLLPDGQSHRYLTFINETFNGNHSKFFFQLGKQEYLIQLLSLIRLNSCNIIYTFFPWISEKINCFDVSVRSNAQAFARHFDFMYFKSSFVDGFTFHFTLLLPN